MRPGDQIVFFLNPCHSVFCEWRSAFVRTKLDVGSAPTLCGLRQKSAEISSLENPDWLDREETGPSGHAELIPMKIFNE